MSSLKHPNNDVCIKYLTVVCDFCQSVSLLASRWSQRLKRRGRPKRWSTGTIISLTARGRHPSDMSNRKCVSVCVLKMCSCVVSCVAIWQRSSEANVHCEWVEIINESIYIYCIYIYHQETGSCLASLPLEILILEQRNCSTVSHITMTSLASTWIHWFNRAVGTSSVKIQKFIVCRLLSVVCPQGPEVHRGGGERLSEAAGIQPAQGEDRQQPVC